ncbi:MAG: phosphatase PAP2 family protein [Coriobacteriales bacterium]|nr:phosphatase PAP2 family protein [Coriobacteriales bacterium]
MSDTRKARHLFTGVTLLAGFALCTALVQLVDVRPVGQNGTSVGFATLNIWFHGLTGVHMALYTITDWLGLVPIAVCLGFATLGAVQLVARRSLLKVDPDILLLGAYYVAVVFFYLLFEMVPVNYRPIPIEGVMEASYPSSTTLLVLSVMPTLAFQVHRRSGSLSLQKATTLFTVTFSAFIVAGRLVSGVHWVTDIVGSALLAFGLFAMYRSAVACIDAKKQEE